VDDWKEQTMRKGEEIWENFVTAFLSEVRSMSDSDRNCFWSGQKARTSSYSELLTRVGARLGMDMVPEYMHVDWQFKRARGPEAGFPQIWVEVENVMGKTLEEMDKLCYLRSYLKILITVGAWPGNWKDEWCSHVKENYVWLPESQATVYGFIVGEAKRAGAGKEWLCYHLFALSTDGKEISAEREELIGELA
jgi:hypothetical protein